MNLKERNILNKYIIYGIPLLIIIGFPMHFLYELSGNITIVGFFSPINESIWEHLKLCFYPILIYWTIGYFYLRKKTSIGVTNWFICCLICILTYIFLQVGLYYLYTGSTGLHMLFLDIMCMVLAITVSQLLALHVYNNSHINVIGFYISLFLIAILIIYFTLYTFDPPKIPLFIDSTNNSYGIYKLK